jgi:hypothetical protein
MTTCKTAQQMPPGDIWTRYALVSSTFRMIFKCFDLSARYCLTFMFLYAMFIKNSDVFANKTVKIKTKSYLSE